MCQNCRNCKHWEVVSRFTRKSSGLRIFHGYCRITNGEGYEPVVRGAKSFALGDGGTGAMLYTDEDFGCTEFAEGTPKRSLTCERETWEAWEKNNVRVTV
jgi:hypothetical protein